MGKRELLIIGAFVLIGALAYQLTAPPPRAGARRFSWTAMTDAWRNRSTRNRGRAEASTRGAVPLPSTASEVSVTGAATLIVTGEPRGAGRPELSWTLDVVSSGVDDEAAARAAAAVSVATDDRGPVFVIAVTGRGSPQGPTPRPASTLTLHVPAGLLVHLEGATRTTVTGTAALRLDGLMGDTIVSHIAGAVTGNHRNGTLTISDVDSVDVTTVATTVTLSGVRGPISANVRNGACQVLAPTAPVTIDANAATVAIERPTGAVRLNGTNGMYTVDNPRGDVRVDAKTARVTILLDAAVPVTATTTDAALRLSIGADVPIDLDAATEQGAITATSLGLTPEQHDRDARLRHTFGDRARVTLRNTRGEIEIALRK